MGTCRHNELAGLVGLEPIDIRQIVDGLVPELQRRGLFRTAYEASTLRGLLGLDRPDSRYAAAGSDDLVEAR